MTDVPVGIVELGPTGPFLVTGVRDRPAADAARQRLRAAADAVVLVLRRVDRGDEVVAHTTWAGIDAVELDDDTWLYVAPAPTADGGYARLHQLVRTLRDQCPWDREQTHASLVPYLVEETFELVDALAALDPDDPATELAVIEELGDVLYQIEFHAVVAEQSGRFTIDQVTAEIHDKLVRRHPHVFGDVTADDSATVVANWDEIKQAEKGRTSVFEGVATSLPALALTQQLMGNAAKLGFDWPDVDGPLAKLDEELAELRAAMTSGVEADIADELGDVMATVVNVARHLGVDAELAARGSAGKFRRRFEAVETLAATRSIDLRTAGLDELDALWREVKTAEA